MHYRVNEQLYTKTLTQFIDKENPPEYILCFEIRNRHTLMNILDMFPNSKFYIVDEPYFIRPLLKWPGKNYSNRVLSYEMLQTGKDTTVDELRGSLEAILKKAGERELTVIMNPPYGNKSKLAKPIIKQLLSYDFIKEIICIAKDSAYKECMQNVKSFKKITNLFENVSVENLTVCKLSFKKISKYDYFVDNISPQLQLLEKSILNYNKLHTCNCIRIAGRNKGPILNRWNKPLKEFVKNFKEFNLLKNKTLAELDKEKYIFYTTVWTPFDGVHIDSSSWDYRLNVLNENMLYENLGFAKIDLHIFNNKESRNNFRNWWYSCNKKIEGNKKQRIGLTNKILDIILARYSGGAGMPAYNTCFPNVDWTRSWTDEEIIQELKDKAGLPKDWKLEE